MPEILLNENKIDLGETQVMMMLVLLPVLLPVLLLVLLLLLLLLLLPVLFLLLVLTSLLLQGNEERGVPPEPVDDVGLPPWATDAHDFIRINREALESGMQQRLADPAQRLLNGCMHAYL